MAERKDDLATLLQKPPRRSRGWLWSGAVALVAALAFAGYWLAQAGTSGTEEATYATAPVARGDLTVTVTATGTLQPTTRVDVSSELAGTLAAVEVDYNDSIAVGQVLARLDVSKIAAQVANAEAQEASARARLVQAEATAREVAATLATQQELADKGLASRSNMVTVEANDARARAAVDMARADLTLAEANLALARADLDKAVIRSPIDGVVLNRKAEGGQIVGPGLNDPVLFVLAENLTRMELLANVDEADIGQVAVGQSAVFTVDAFDNREFVATITQVRYASEVTDDVVTYKAVLAVDNPDLRLRPGMTATATITVAEETGALLVPNAALRWAPPRSASGQGAAGLAGLILPSPASRNPPQAVASGRSLWVLRGGVPVEVAVAIGATDGRNTIVSGAELAEGDAVITDQVTQAN
ncbi:efflux RND transporter periplasmic adaptor subunit [Tabrizicola oligotrophica]|uniref:Efflux RND transporter periplasmic adaptor subunit n=1 Tax=Tabrizicola oligotrophica TaxID=2710650 RepID=A0A6M0QV15_9RHOB|nr:efflux RND transporter periplasmic adaptor subunit [Tabrizicola oligotrophica]NEY90694.1 efflux RND transporter periplasmic adaptor subunit [Tabrizicola oligotrophica]